MWRCWGSNQALFFLTPSATGSVSGSNIHIVWGNCQHQICGVKLGIAQLVSGQICRFRHILYYVRSVRTLRKFESFIHSPIRRRYATLRAAPAHPVTASQEISHVLENPPVTGVVHRQVTVLNRQVLKTSVGPSVLGTQSLKMA